MSAAEIKKLINKRKSVSKKVEKLSALAHKAAQDGEGSPSFKNFLVRYDDLSEFVNTFQTLHLEIMSLIEEETVAEHDAAEEIFDDLQYSIKSFYRDFMEKSVNDKLENPSIAGNSSKSSNNNKCDRVRLPQLEIPKFDGDIRKWPTFFDMFKTLIHECTSLSKIEKFQYLISYLERDASNVIKNIPITDDNYETAYNCLVQRYQNERVLITNYWLSVYRADSMKNNNAFELRKLLSTFSENFCALNQFKTIDLWDFTKLNLLLQKLDPSLKTLFEIQYSDKIIPSYNDLREFLDKQCRAMENTQLFSRSTKPYQISDKSKKGGLKESDRHIPSYFTKKKSNSNSNLNERVCPFCKQGVHTLIKCDMFLSSEVEKRHAFIKNSRWCYNCFSSLHVLDRCDSKFKCRVCDKRHHTLLHFPQGQRSDLVVHSDSASGSSFQEPKADNLKVLTSTSCSQKSMIFATAKVLVRNHRNQPVECRVLLDSASQANFIIEKCVQRLGLKKSHSSTPIQGLNQMSMCASLGNVEIKLTPCDKINPLYNVDCIVLPNICGALPSVDLQFRNWKYLQGLRLADPEYHTSSDIDILLGVEFFSEMIIPGFRKGKNGGPCALNSTLGWVLFGSVDSVHVPGVLSCFTSVDSHCTDSDKVLQRFWEVECVPQATQTLSVDDQLCENIFVKTCSRAKDGRYSVDLPFRTFPPLLGESRAQALRRFYSLESKLNRNPELKVLYHNFMQDYVDQGHMQLAKTLHPTNHEYFIPHHCIVKGDIQEGRIRVVFDGSCKSSNSASLNDTLLTGPKLQRDISSILLNFRVFPIVFTTDIRQMYRQILVNENHRDFQKILWRFSSSETVQEYHLNTVTYGVSSSPYLAIRTLLQLVEDYGSVYPLASDVIRHSCYVDDVMGGAFSEMEALALQQQLISLVGLGKFELRKWASNNPALLKSVPSSHQQAIPFGDKDFPGVKVLGLQWSPVTDSFSYSVMPVNRECTKRNILSEIARIYDVVGFLCPVVLMAKCMIQKLWLQGLGWDDVPSPELVHQWQLYRDQLPLLSSISIPRQIIYSEKTVTELHGFSDASEAGYAAVIYFRQLVDDRIFISMICAKSKVAPLKRLSLPRLELCAASLLADLVEFVVANIRGVLISRIFAWSDSTVTLTWIRSSPHKWKTFVANRVSQIQEKIPPNCWSYVSGKMNPADCASRGLLPEQLASHSLWWAGPPWLRQPSSEWPSGCSENRLEDIAGEERRTVCLSTTPKNHWHLLIERFSSLRKIQGIVAYCLRFTSNVRKPLDKRDKGPLTYRELYSALVILVKVVQEEVFADDIAKIKQGLSCSKPLRQLVPFIDSFGVVRVGGRLRNSELSFDAKHPILLPRDHQITRLITLQFHLENCHPGPRGLLYLLSQQFWILSARRVIRSVLSKCYRCFRVNPPSLTPLMGDLPAVRVSQVKAFVNSGVDFAGPVNVTLGKRRGICSQKAYICVFICLATKALHLEVVSDLSSEAFLAALRRFVARRGRCSTLFSDRGTNFVGAHRLLLSYCESGCESLAIQWSFNPPASPHFGGIWESAVKSVKSNLLRVIGTQVLTFEELSTVLAQIEAALNSRPLCSLSPDPNDLSSLTPGHFLTMEPLTAPPDEDLTMCNVNRLKRWQLVQQLQQHFWRRWHVEYLHNLQQRQKWNTAEHPPKEGALVVLKDNNLAPLRWSLGRIMKIYSSPDKVARVAQIRTTKGLVDRPLVKLCPLPVW